MLAAVLTFGGLIVAAYCSFRSAYTIQTSADARIEDVNFLRLPDSASTIGFWRDGINYVAEFNVPEDAFRKLFKEYALQEIAKPIEVQSKTFGDPSVFPMLGPKVQITVGSGLYYAERWRNGGGYEIVYDRERLRAYYTFNKR